MMCDCQRKTEERLLERFKQQCPEAKNHTATLTGYAVVFEGNSAITKGCMPVELSATYQLKNGGFKDKKTKANMIFNYCPFCGKKYENEGAK